MCPENSAYVSWPFRASRPNGPCRGSGPVRRRAAQCRMSPPAIIGFTHRMLAECLDIEAVWSLDHAPGEAWRELPHCRLLAIASAAVLKRLQACEHLHHSQIELLVVVDGDEFASAWGAVRSRGSLARWAWRQTNGSEAFYDEPCWDEREGANGAVARVRRKAFLVWQGDKSPQQHGRVYNG